MTVTVANGGCTVIRCHVKGKKEAIAMKMAARRLTLEERDALLKYAWLNQIEFARLLEMSEITLSTRLGRGEYSDLYVTVGASRKFNTEKVKRFLKI